jgi:hypothetical protein
MKADISTLHKPDILILRRHRISHFLTTQAEAYMNGAFQSLSATEDLTRIPDREPTGGIKRKG